MALTHLQLDLFLVLAFLIIFIGAAAWYASRHPDQF